MGGSRKMVLQNQRPTEGISFGKNGRTHEPSDAQSTTPSYRSALTAMKKTQAPWHSLMQHENGSPGTASKDFCA